MLADGLWWVSSRFATYSIGVIDGHVAMAAGGWGDTARKLLRCTPDEATIIIREESIQRGLGSELSHGPEPLPISEWF